MVPLPADPVYDPKSEWLPFMTMRGHKFRRLNDPLWPTLLVIPESDPYDVMLQIRQWRGWLLHTGGMIAWLTNPAKALAARPFLQRLAETKAESAIGWVCEIWKSAFEIEIPFHPTCLRILRAGRGRALLE